MRYFDTTVLCRRVFGEEWERQAASLCVDGDVAITSGYVEQEYAATFVDAAVAFHKLLIDSPTKREALARLQKIRPPSKERRVYQLLSALCDDEGETREKLIGRLELWLDQLLWDYFRDGLDASQCHNEMNCTRCPSLTPRRVGERYTLDLHCDQDNTQGCRIHEFWAGRRGHLERLAAASEALTNQQDVVAAAREVTEEGRPPAGKRCYLRLSDAVIVLAAPDDATVCSSDKHFVPLCELLGRQLLNPLVQAASR